MNGSQVTALPAASVTRRLSCAVCDWMILVAVITSASFVPWVNAGACTFMLVAIRMTIWARPLPLSCTVT